MMIYHCEKGRNVALGAFDFHITGDNPQTLVNDILKQHGVLATDGMLLVLRTKAKLGYVVNCQAWAPEIDDFAFNLIALW